MGQPRQLSRKFEPGTDATFRAGKAWITVDRGHAESVDQTTRLQRRGENKGILDEALGCG